MSPHTDVEIEGRTLRLSNLDKVLYPRCGFTKGQVIDYYTRISAVLLPHLRGRPLTLKRYPDGVEGPFFYEKRCPKHRPDWVRTAPIWSDRNAEAVPYCLAEDLPTLVWAANAHSDEVGLSHSLLAESEAVIDDRNTLFGRAEYVQKPAEDLGISGAALSGADNGRFGVSRVSLGYIREIATIRGATLGIGGVGSVSFVPSSLQTTYGSGTPTGLTIFLRLRPIATAMPGMAGK